jgi:hypothetical protein
MPSAALKEWQNDRIPRLQHIENQCAVALALVPPNAQLAEENLRGYVVLLSAHFQAFCRNLYTESAQAITSKVRLRLRMLVEDQFTAHRSLDHGNPNFENLQRDFNRFDFELGPLLTGNAANALQLQHLAILNQWRNVAAHQGTKFPTGGPLDLPSLQAWRQSCDGLAISLDSILYNQLRIILRRNPW